MMSVSSDLIQPAVPVISAVLFGSIICYKVKSFFSSNALYNWPVSSVAKRKLSVREDSGSIGGPVKSTQCRQWLPPLRRFFGAV